MAQVINFLIADKEYYQYYMGTVHDLVVTQSIIDEHAMQIGDTIVLNCFYSDTATINKGRHIAPIYRTVTYIGPGNIDGHENLVIIGMR